CAPASCLLFFSSYSLPPHLHSFPTRRSSDLLSNPASIAANCLTRSPPSPNPAPRFAGTVSSKPHVPFTTSRFLSAPAVISIPVPPPPPTSPSHPPRSTPLGIPPWHSVFSRSHGSLKLRWSRRRQASTLCSARSPIRETPAPACASKRSSTRTLLARSSPRNWPGSPVPAAFDGMSHSPFQDNARHHLHNRYYRSHASVRAGTLQRKCGLSCRARS